MAKDVRKFVQDFNMSRKSFDDGEWPLAETLDPAPEISDGEVSRQKRRNDWSAYLDQEDHHTLEEQHLHHDGLFYRFIQSIGILNFRNLFLVKFYLFSCLRIS